MLSTNEGNFSSSIPAYICFYFFFLSYCSSYDFEHLIGQLCFIPDLKTNFLQLSSFNMLVIGLSWVLFMIFKYIPTTSVFFEVLFIPREGHVMDFVKGLFASIEM